MKILGPNDVGYGLLFEYDSGFVSPKEEHNKLILEEIKKTGVIPSPFIIYAILSKADTENKNGRMYPYEIMKREGDKYKQLLPNRSISELDHPESSIISLDRVAHRIVDMWWEGKTLIGKLEIMTTRGFRNEGIVSTKGDQAAWLILEYGIMLGISSRGVGSLKKQGETNVVQDDFELICFDIVSSPSSPGSYLFTDMNQMKNLPENYKRKDKLVEGLDNFLLSII